ncbi:MAG: hypothetical protein Q9220_003612 [cf. Caloplaca sp. 1 TL-2023]
MSWLDGKREPGPTKQNIDVLKSKSISPTSQRLNLTPEQAFAKAEEALKGHVRHQIACMKAQTMTNKMKNLLPYQVFNELDKEFFRSVLKGNVSLGWSALPSGTLSRTCCAGHKGNPRIRIELSPLLRRPNCSRRDVFAALIHQMVHAYYLQCCGHRDLGYTDTGHDLAHEQPFQALLKLIEEHCDPLQETLSAKLWTPEKRCRSCERTDQAPTSGVSSCYDRINRFNSVDIQDWRNLATATADSLQESPKSRTTQYWTDGKYVPHVAYFVSMDGSEQLPKPRESWQHPPEAYIFLVFEFRYYPVLRSSVGNLDALLSSPRCRDKRCLELPQSVSSRIFLVFYFFLVYGMYPPFMRILAPQSALNPGWTKQTSAIIKTYDDSAPALLGSLISAFHLGKILQYRPFCDYALNGLRNVPSIAEDPILPLEKIYRNSLIQDGPLLPFRDEAPDPQLRQWAKQWLAVPLPPDVEVEYRTRFTANLGVVKYHPSWSSRYSQLKAISTELREDDNAVAHNILSSYNANTTPNFEAPLPAQQSLRPPQALYPVARQQVGHGFNTILPSELFFEAGQNDHLDRMAHRNGRGFPDLSALRSSLPSNDMRELGEIHREFPGYISDEHRLALLEHLQQGPNLSANLDW